LIARDPISRPAPVLLQNTSTANAEGGQPMAVLIEGGIMAKTIRQKKSRKTGIRHLTMKWLTSARVKNFLIRKAN